MMSMFHYESNHLSVVAVIRHVPSKYGCFWDDPGSSPMGFAICFNDNMVPKIPSGNLT